MLSDLHRPKRFERRRASSYAGDGSNHDSVVIAAGDEYRVASLTGPGIVRHIWMTVAGESPRLYQDLELVVHCDGSDEPQVAVPLADFFCFGHGLLVDVDAAPIQVSRQPHIDRPPYCGGLNCLFPMPFDRVAEFSFRNRGDEQLVVYYYVDWEAHQALADPAHHFHATLNEEHTEPPAGQVPQSHGEGDGGLINVDTAENYRLLAVEGMSGHYVGTALSIDCRAGGAGKWWEGDDVFVIDGEPWPPRLHGTGTEDYFNLAWGFRRVDCRPEHGVTFLEKRDGDSDQIDGRFSLYRFHLNDPIPFTRALDASLEHGHANDCQAYYRSVAYWYGRAR